MFLQREENRPGDAVGEAVSNSTPTARSWWRLDTRVGVSRAGGPEVLSSLGPYLLPLQHRETVPLPFATLLRKLTLNERYCKGEQVIFCENNVSLEVGSHTYIHIFKKFPNQSKGKREVVPLQQAGLSHWLKLSNLLSWSVEVARVPLLKKSA